VLPEVFMTGFVSSGLSRSALSAPEVPVLRKPFLAEALISALTNAWSAAD
jgi:CheY-like chemotaxis protein